MPKPRALRAGDLIEVVSPSSPIAPYKTERGKALLEDWGFRVRFSKHCFEQDAYLAGTDEQRASDLMAAFADPEVACVFCARGGYGAARLFPYLDLDAMAASGRLFAGFSDITTLHTSLNRRGLPTLHAPMLLTLAPDRPGWVHDSLREALTGGDPITAFDKKVQTVVGGTAEGEVTGGCLILMCDSLGTPEAIDCTGKIVILEDVDENPHRVDAMLTHLINSGEATKAAGFVVGEMTRTDEREDSSIGTRPWRNIVAERLAPLGKPMITDFPFGHAPAMLTLPLGVRARLDANAGTVTYLEKVCE